MSSIPVNDVFEELSEENKRLLNELMFANKCLNVFIEFKVFVDLVFDKLKTNLDSNESQKFKKLSKEVEEVIEYKEKISKNLILNDSRVENNSFVQKISSDFQKSSPKTKSVMPSKVAKIAVRKTNRILKRKKTIISSDVSDFDDKSFESNDGTEEQPNTQITKQEINENNESLDLKNRIICEYIGCGKHYSSRDSMRAHYKTHFIENSLACDVEGCNYRTWTRKYLVAHINGHKGIRPHICSSCGKGFLCAASVRHHKKQVHSVSDQMFICQIDGCNKEFTKVSSFKNHQKYMHLIEKRFACDHPNCDFRAAQNSHIKYHKEQNHSKVRPYICTFEGCPKAFYSRKSLLSHSIRHKPERDYKCPEQGCDKAYKTNKDLKNHQLVHSDVTVGCDWPGCDFQTKYPLKLKGHQLIHTSNRDFLCHWPQCGRAFKRKAQLGYHLRIHNGDKRYACHWPGCQYRCVDSTNLKKHLRIHRID